MDHTQQLAYFAQINYDERFRWQTEDVFVRQQEHQTIRPLARALLELRRALGRPIKALEIGCGEGVNMIHLRQLGLTAQEVELVGIDMSPEAVAEATRHGLRVEIGNGLHLPYPDASFDAAFCRDVFHHLIDDGERTLFFNQMMRVTRSGGFVMAIEPNPQNPLIFLLSMIVRAEKGLRQISERRMRFFFPGADVERLSPSAAWRLWYHYRSPFSRVESLVRITRFCLRAWQSFCRAIAPTAFWSYRVYTWKK